MSISLNTLSPAFTAKTTQGKQPQPAMTQQKPISFTGDTLEKSEKAKPAVTTESGLTMPELLMGIMATGLALAIAIPVIGNNSPAFRETLHNLMGVEQEEVQPAPQEPTLPQ